MTALGLWMVVILAAAVAVSLTLSLGVSTWRGGLAPLGRRVSAFAIAAVGLLLLGSLWKVHGIAHLDAQVITRLATKRSDEVVTLMTALTTIGDAVPSMVIAAVLAVIIYLQGRRRVLAFYLPVLVMIELIVQTTMGKVFHDLTIGHLAPHTVLGGIGTIPSGSVARLSSIFLVAAWLCLGERLESQFVALGGGLLILQIVTRLYLGRHLLGDIVGGLLLGLLLTWASVTLMELVSRTAPGARERAPA